MSNLKELQIAAKNLSILYVEDNKLLRENAAKLLKKFFVKVDLAEDGQVGLEMFKKFHYPIVVTDIKMPNMDGIELTKNIKKISPDTKTIIMSAFDDKKLLFKGIELGIFRFLKKPVNVTELSDVLYKAILEIKNEVNTKLFYSHLKNIFNYQSSMVIMLHDSKILLANDMFLEFFNFDSIDECRESSFDVTKYFLEHDSFLYNSDEVNALESIKENPQKLFHVKIKNKANDIKHFILKYQEIPEKPNHGVLSFDDITELNLLKLFDVKQSTIDEETSNNHAMLDLLNVIHRNSAKIELHNYYKGLSITNDGIIVDISNDIVTIKTSFMQQKVVQIEKKVLLVSSVLPYPVESLEIIKISFEKQTIELKALKFVQSSPITRSTIRVVPDDRHTVSLFMGENKFHGDVEIEDISLNAVKLKLNALPAGLNEDSEITLNIVLELDKKPMIVHTEVTLFRKTESRHSYSVVFTFGEFKKSELVKYITKRQMALIREIKGIQNG